MNHKPSCDWREHITAGCPWKAKFSHVSSITQDLWGEQSQNPQLQGSAQLPKCPVLLCSSWSHVLDILFPNSLIIKLTCNSGLAVPCKSHIYHEKIEHSVTTRGLHQRTHPLSLALLHLYAQLSSDLLVGMSGCSEMLLYWHTKCQATMSPASISSVTICTCTSLH